MPGTARGAGPWPPDLARRLEGRPGRVLVHGRIVGELLAGSPFGRDGVEVGTPSGPFLPCEDDAGAVGRPGGGWPARAGRRSGGGTPCRRRKPSTRDSPASRWSRCRRSSGRYTLMPSGSRNSSRRISPGCTGGSLRPEATSEKSTFPRSRFSRLMGMLIQASTSARRVRAANLRAARTPSRVRRGCSSRTCSIVSPAESFSRINSTVMRVPATTGFPIITVGSHWMRSASILPSSVGSHR